MTKESPRVKRRYPRLSPPKVMLVAWQGGGQHMVSRVRTMGLGGLFISTPNPPPVGTVVKLIFEVPGGEVRARAIVRNAKPGRGMGVEFTGMGFQDRARMSHLLNQLFQ